MAIILVVARVQQALQAPQATSAAACLTLHLLLLVARKDPQRHNGRVRGAAHSNGSDARDGEDG